MSSEDTKTPTVLEPHPSLLEDGMVEDTHMSNSANEEMDHSTIETTTASANGEREPCPVFVEPSPLARRLKDEKPFNNGDWTSVELKLLYDAVKKYGTTQVAIDYTADIILTKSTAAVHKKINEIREILNEYRGERMNHEYDHWNTLGHENVRVPPEYIPRDEITGVDRQLQWYSAFSRVLQPHRSLSSTILREAIAEGFAKEGPVYPSVTVSESLTSRSCNRQSTLSWSRINEFLYTVMKDGHRVPRLNHLEAAVILSVLDDINNEASGICEEDKAIIKGWLVNIHKRDFRDFEPNVPCTTKSVAQVLLDPLRTRLSDVPAGGIIWSVEEESSDGARRYEEGRTDETSNWMSAQK